MNYQFENIPDELQEVPQWIVWRGAPKDNGKMDKKPATRDGESLSGYLDGNGWMTIQDAIAAYEKNDRLTGVGFVLTENDPFIGIDMDECIDPETGVIQSWALQHLYELDTYSEKSPSGTGVRAIGTGTMPDSFPKNVGQREIYFAKRFLTFTGGEITSAKQLPDITERVSPYIEAMRAEKEKRKNVSDQPKSIQPIGETRRGTTPYGQAALGGEITELNYAPEGERNTALNKAAFRVAQLVAGGEIDQGVAIAELEQAALSTGLGMSETTKTLQSGFEAGLREAREAPESTGLKAVNKVDKSTLPFQLTSIGDILDTPPHFRWLIRKWLLADSEAMMVGESTVGKSFVALDWSLSIATGKEWNGHKVEQAPVVYITGEGFQGLRLRTKAWAQVNGSLGNAPFTLSEQAADFMDDTSLEAVTEAVGAFAEDHDGKVGMVVVDTLHRNMGGDENSSVDFGMFIRNLRKLCHPYGAASIVVHHSGHGDKSRGRGTSAQKASLDTKYLVLMEGDSRVLKCDKLKDGGETPSPVGFKLEQVALPWLDDEGEALTSCVVEWGDAPTPKGKKMPAGVKLGLTTLLTVDKNKPVSLDQWRDEFCKKHTGDTAGAKRTAFSRARNDLVTSGVLTVENNVYSIAESYSAPWNDVNGLIGALRLSDLVNE